ncbi:hypothetical protein [Streptomyces sp. NPDC002559]
MMQYLPTAVAVGYVHDDPDVDLPLPGPDFAEQVGILVAATSPPGQEDKPRRRLGPGPAEHHSPAETDTPAPGLVHPPVQAADAGTLYRPDLDSLASTHARGVLGHRPVVPDAAPRTYSHGAGARAES